MDESRAIVPLNENYTSLGEFVGDWKVTQRSFPAPGATPLERNGTCTCRALIDGRATLMETKLANPDGSDYQSFTLVTYNINKAGFEGVFLDVHSFDGFDPLHGGSLKAPGPASAAAVGTGTVKRVWEGSIGIPRTGAISSNAQDALLGVDRINIQFVENRINESKWVLLGFADDGKGDSYVTLEQTFTK